MGIKPYQINLTEIQIRVAYASFGQPLPVGLNTMEVLAFFDMDADSNVALQASNDTTVAISKALVDYMTKVLIEATATPATLTKH